MVNKINLGAFKVRLIDFVKSNPELYNSKTGENNGRIRKRIWQSFATEFEGKKLNPN